ncbi:histidine phosphatase superfamily [Halteromyces radiatus]|uniref:histidine phosphatase superfamily n=1 Tax=Halteromyces radiatus TaxID=101107 RepID=UPI00221E83D7|nr:histidine phosphatase superfamily [Halteromyces radiatus]KAI8081325.1 histidine phosphatase superfamily [Halteromyces radiatus]
MVLITLVRHGNTDANNQRILQGQTDTILNDMGHRQASLVANRLKQERFDKIYCSDLLRCQQTAQAIRDHHVDTPITLVRELRERSFGDLSGLSIKHVFAQSNQQKMDASTFVKNHGGETEKEFAKRVIDAYINIVNEATQEGYQHILIVSHGGCLRSLCLWWTSTTKYEYDGDLDRLRRGHHGNTGVSQVRVSQGNPTVGVVELFSCSNHLNSIDSTFDIPPSV